MQKYLLLLVYLILGGSSLASFAQSKFKKNDSWRYQIVTIARDFMVANKYIFPAAHSDTEIEKLYKIRGYPTKVLVSPDGKMLDLQFGADYAAILQTYSNTYFSNEKGQQPPLKIDNKKKD